MPFGRCANIATLTAAALCLAMTPLHGQTVRRMADGKPDLNGIWQALNTANWDLQEHAAARGLVVQLGAVGAEPGRPGSGGRRRNPILACHER